MKQNVLNCLSFLILYILDYFKVETLLDYF